MRRILLTAVAVCGVFVLGISARAADEKEIKGILIDTACGTKQMSKDNPEESAAGHPKACVQKCVKGGSTLSLISGKKIYELDAKGAEMANKYLASDTGNTKAIVVGTINDAGNKITVKEVKAQEQKKS
ncbi:MAG TPA: hypothetical protein VFB66_25190 [Tepidisphaeraceae bacterium]|nr:hypothetical protein [Tepidisphaeraceae bacterium]